MPMIPCKHCGDVEPAIRPNGPHLSAYCTKCGCFIKHVPQSDTDFTMPFGKYKGVKASEIVRDDREYAKWAYFNMDKLPSRYLSILQTLLS
jgi:uncharacterized protein (DUF3820 family)